MEGLPDWRSPIYYYRRARKMSLLEISIILTVVISLTQYLMAWGTYIDKKQCMVSVCTCVCVKEESHVDKLWCYSKLKGSKKTLEYTRHCLATCVSLFLVLFHSGILSCYLSFIFLCFIHYVSVIILCSSSIHHFSVCIISLNYHPSFTSQSSIFLLAYLFPFIIILHSYILFTFHPHTYRRKHWLKNTRSRTGKRKNLRTWRTFY